MPEIGRNAGEDNVTGDRYTMDLGVEPDLGNLLQNIQLANDLLDSAEQKFVAIGEVVNTTTQRIAAMTRQTELAVAQAQRLSTSFQGISGANLALGNLGMVGGMAGGMMPGQFPGMPYIPGAQAFQGMPAMEGAAAGELPFLGREGEDIDENAPAEPVRREHFPLSVRAASLEQLNEHMRGGTGAISGAINKMKAGYRVGRGKAETFTGALQGVTSEGLTGKEAETAAAGVAGVEAGALGGLGEVAGVIAPYALAGGAAYKLLRDALVGSTRLTGETGGTGVFTSSTGGFGQSYVGLQANKWYQGLLHPGIGVGNMGNIQESLLANGYIGGEGGLYNNAQQYLMSAYSQGMGTVIDQLDVYKEAVDKGGASVADLSGAMEQMRIVARNSNASLTEMAKNYKTNLENFITLGLGGTAASFAATVQATSWAQSTMGQLNPSLRGFAGYDLNNIVMRAGVANQLGVNYMNLGVSAYGNPTIGQNLPILEENQAISTIESLGFTKDMSLQQIDEFMKTHQGDLTGQILQTMGALPTNIDPNNVRDVIDFIKGAFDHSARKNIQGSLNALTPTRVTAASLPVNTAGAKITTSAEIIGNMSKNTTGAIAHAYITQKLGMNTGGTDHPIASFYESYLNTQHNGKAMMNIPILDKIIQNGDENTSYVKDGNTLVPLRAALERPDLLKKIIDGTALISTASTAQSNLLNNNPLSSKQRQTTVQDMLSKTATEAEIMGGQSKDPGRDAEGHQRTAFSGTTTTDISQKSIYSLADEIARAMNK